MTRGGLVPPFFCPTDRRKHDLIRFDCLEQRHDLKQGFRAASDICSTAGAMDNQAAKARLKSSVMVQAANPVRPDSRDCIHLLNAKEG